MVGATRRHPVRLSQVKPITALAISSIRLGYIVHRRLFSADHEHIRAIDYPCGRLHYARHRARPCRSPGHPRARPHSSLTRPSARSFALCLCAFQAMPFCLHYLCSSSLCHTVLPRSHGLPSPRIPPAWPSRAARTSPSIVPFMLLILSARPSTTRESEVFFSALLLSTACQRRC